MVWPALGLSSVDAEDLPDTCRGTHVMWPMTRSGRRTTPLITHDPVMVLNITTTHRPCAKEVQCGRKESDALRRQQIGDWTGRGATVNACARLFVFVLCVPGGVHACVPVLCGCSGVRNTGVPLRGCACMRARRSAGLDLGMQVCWRCPGRWVCRSGRTGVQVCGFADVRVCGWLAPTRANSRARAHAHARARVPVCMCELPHSVHCCCGGGHPVVWASTPCLLVRPPLGCIRIRHRAAAASPANARARLPATMHSLSFIPP
eukprot:15474036-Alexandrium_andersonii.AAC.1